MILRLNPAVNTSLSRPQLDVTWPQKWIIEGPKNYIGVGVARSQGPKSAGTTKTPLSKYSFIEREGPGSTVLVSMSQHEFISKFAEPWIVP